MFSRECYSILSFECKNLIYPRCFRFMKDENYEGVWGGAGWRSGGSYRMENSERINLHWVQCCEEGPKRCDLQLYHVFVLLGPEPTEDRNNCLSHTNPTLFHVAMDCTAMHYKCVIYPATAWGSSSSSSRKESRYRIPTKAWSFTPYSRVSNPAKCTVQKVTRFHTNDQDLIPRPVRAWRKLAWMQSNETAPYLSAACPL